MVVLSPERGEFAELADEIADYRDEPVVEALDSVGPGQTVVLVSSASVDEELLLDLQRRFLEHGPEHGRFSIITGLDVDSARRLYESDGTTTDDERHVALMTDGQQGSVSEGNSAIYTKQDVSLDTVRRELDRGLTSLTLHLPGRQIHTWLDDGLICGVPELRSLDEATDPLPYCIEDGQQNCPITDEDRLLHADEIDADHYFVVSCSKTVDNGSCDKVVNVGLHLLDDASSLIGTYYVGYHPPFLTLLHHALVRAGYDLAERCYLLNRSAHDRDTVAYPYIPMGRPDASTGERRAHAEYELSSDGGMPSITLRNVDAPVIDISIPKAALPSEILDTVYLRRKGDPDHNTYRYVTLPEGETIRILVCTASQVRSKSLTFELDTEPYGNDRRHIGWDALRNARQARTWGFLPEESSGQIRNLRDQLKSLRRQREQEAVNPDAWIDMEDRIKSMLGDVRSLRDDVLAEVGVDRVKEYHRGAMSHSCDTTNVFCPVCDRRLFAKTSTYPDADPRVIGLCPRCGGSAFDLPANEKLDEQYFPYLSVEEVAEDGTVVLTFTNPREIPMSVLFHPTVWQVGGELSGESLFEPREVERKLQPSETATVEFDLDTDRLWDNEHYVLFRAIGNLSIYSRGVTIPVGNSYGYLHPKYRDDASSR